MPAGGGLSSFVSHEQRLHQRALCTRTTPPAPGRRATRQGFFAELRPDTGGQSCGPRAAARGWASRPGTVRCCARGVRQVRQQARWGAQGGRRAGRAPRGSPTAARAAPGSRCTAAGRAGRPGPGPAPASPPPAPSRAGRAGSGSARSMRRHAAHSHARRVTCAADSTQWVARCFLCDQPAGEPRTKSAGSAAPRRRARRQARTWTCRNSATNSGRFCSSSNATRQPPACGRKPAGQAISSAYRQRCSSSSAYSCCPVALARACQA